MKDIIGKWGFVIGLAIAVIMGLFEVGDTIPLLLVVLGLLVGLMNVTSKESLGFLVAAIALMVGGTSFLEVFPGAPTLIAIMKAVILFVASAAFPVVFRQLFGTLREK
ncbi:MAG: hypothetical protein ACMXYL_05045 [Candidatus Woesearchaeota archaeon]